MELLQTDPVHRSKWIEYSARDAIATWFVRDQLENRLKDMPWEVNGKILGNMYDYYMKVEGVRFLTKRHIQYMCQFGELLTDMERNGIKVPSLDYRIDLLQVDVKGHVRQAEIKARSEREKVKFSLIDFSRAVDGKNFLGVGCNYDP